MHSYLKLRGKTGISVNERAHYKNLLICDTGAQNSSFFIFGFFYSIIFYTASASKYVLQNILFLTEVILIYSLY